MQRCCEPAGGIGEFGDVNLDGAVQQIKPETEKSEHEQLYMPRKFKRNQRQCAGRERASADHEMTLRYGSDQGWNRNRINNTAESEACDHGSRNGCARFAGCNQ